MNADCFAEWLSRQGHEVTRTASSYWVQAGPRIYQAFPYHWLIEPAEDELTDLLKRQRAIALRYSTPFEASQGQVSYHVVLANKPYTAASLSKKARYDVNQGLKHVRVEPIAFARLAEEGWRLRTDTLARQGRSGAESREGWRRLCMSAEGLPGFEAWGAIHQGELAAALLAFTLDDCCSILYQQSLSAHLKHEVNNALAFVFTGEALGRAGVSRVFYGLHSLDAPASVDEFKFRMGYEPQPVRQRVVSHPWLARFFTPASHRLIKQLMRRRPNSHSLPKAEGILRFYLEGRRPAQEQVWPEALARHPSEPNAAASRTT
ncbi:MAG: hypothetical protein HY259_04465 [Chloroflexi bacterium]|nr:hypothetical protein [Chloroflexota bacterium]